MISNNSDKQYAMNILKKQFKDIQQNPNTIFSVGLVDDNFFKWTVCFMGPNETLYEGGLYNAELYFPETFPNMPPKMVFTTPMWHPNIYDDGTVCISILHPPGKDQFNEQEQETEKWRPILGVEQILQSVLSLLCQPNIDSPANVDAAVHFKNDYNEYKKKLRRMARQTME